MTQVLEEIFNQSSFDASKLENIISIGKITERDKLVAAKQILLGLAILYIITLFAYLFKSNEDKLIEICMNTIPSCATFIMGAYFGYKSH